MTPLSILVRPLTAFALFFLAALIAWPIKRWLSGKRWARALLEPMPVIPCTEAERKDWRPVLYIVLANVFIFGLIGLLVGS